jgi:hypothetical protein
MESAVGVINLVGFRSFVVDGMMVYALDFTLAGNYNIIHEPQRPPKRGKKRNCFPSPFRPALLPSECNRSARNVQGERSSTDTFTPAEKFTNLCEIIRHGGGHNWQEETRLDCSFNWPTKGRPEAINTKQNGMISTTYDVTTNGQCEGEP